jgi:hypothetical protein
VGAAGIGGVLIYHNRHHIFKGKGKNAAKAGTLGEEAAKAFEKAKI